MQPVAGNQWYAVNTTTVSTVTVSADPCVLRSVYVPAATTGTLTVYDSASGTAAKSLRVINQTSDFPYAIPLDVQMSKGLTVETSGTLEMSLVWSK